jgi:hypothetical protein
VSHEQIWETGPNGRVSAGIATQGATFADIASTPRPFAAPAFLGSWTATFLSPANAVDASRLGTLRLDRIDNTFLSAAERAKFDGLAGQFSDAENGRFDVRALIERARPNDIVVRLRRTAPVAENRIWEVAGYHLIHANGIIISSSASPSAALASSSRIVSASAERLRFSRRSIAALAKVG